MRFAVTKLLYVYTYFRKYFRKYNVLSYFRTFESTVLSYFRKIETVGPYFRTVTRCTLYVYVYYMYTSYSRPGSAFTD